MGRHALVGRARIFTPLRVCLLMAIVVLICGWLFKSACIQQGPNGAGGVTLDQGGQRPWITACYNDAVPLFGSHQAGQGRTCRTRRRGRTTARPGTWSTRSSPGTGCGRWPRSPAATSIRAVHRGPAGAAGRRRVLHHRRHLSRPDVPVGGRRRRRRIARRRIWDTAIMCLSPLLVVHAFTNWDLLAIGITAGGDAGLGAQATGAGRGADRAGSGGEAVPDPAARAVADAVPARRENGRLEPSSGRCRRGLAGHQRAGHGCRTRTAGTSSSG